MPQQPSIHRNAYLVLAHDNLDMLNILTKRLVNTGFVYIHIDRLSSIGINQVFLHPKVKVTKQFKVNWGGYSTIEAIQSLADQALEENSTRLTLLSGVTYPIVSDEKLTQFAVSDVEYFEAGEVDLGTQTQTFVRRFTTRHFSFHLKQNLYGRIVRRLSREFWFRMPHIDPGKELAPLKLTLGSLWWSVTADTYNKSIMLMDQHPNIEKYFKKIECCDESIFGTIFHYVSPNHVNHGTTYVKWIGQGGPKPLVQEDIRREQLSGTFLFARKIDSISVKMLTQVGLIGEY